jgi:hypothetical protein
MPYNVRYDRKLGKWVVCKQDTGKILGKHDTKPQAEKQKAAILINEHAPNIKRK